MLISFFMSMVVVSYSSLHSLMLSLGVVGDNPIHPSILDVSLATLYSPVVFLLPLHSVGFFFFFFFFLQLPMFSCNTSSTLL